MRAGRVEEAGALARQIGRDIARRSKCQLKRIDGKTNIKDLWRAVRQLTGRERESAADPGITADSLNRHYASMSTDSSYEQPRMKATAAECPGWMHHVTDYEVFRMLDKLPPTATGLDKLPAWFLRLAAPVLCGPIADLINLSLLTSTVPRQWKQACIRPVLKKNDTSRARCGLPAHFNHVDSDACDGKDCSSTLHLSSVVVASAYTAL